MKRILITTAAHVLICINCFSQNWQWVKGEKGSSLDEGVGIAADSSGNAYATGYFLSDTVYFDTDTLTNSVGGGLFLTKYDTAGNVQWLKGASSKSRSKSNSVAADLTGNSYITGGFGYCGNPIIFFDSDTLKNSGGSDIFLVKYDASGKVVWARNGGGTANEEGACVAVSKTDDRSVYVTGKFNSDTLTFESYSIQSHATYNYYLVKYDSAGSVQWLEGATGSSDNAGLGVTTDAEGNVYVTGYFLSDTIIFDSDTIYHNNADIFIVKYDANGNVAWAKSVGGDASDYANSITADAQNNIYITGSFASSFVTFDSDTLTNSGSTNLFIAKFDTDGNTLWAKKSGGTENDIGYAITTDASGNVIITGGFSSPSISFDTITLYPPESDCSPYTCNPGFIAEFDPSGIVIFATAISSGGDDRSGIACGAYNDFYVCNDFMDTVFVLGSDTLLRSGSYCGNIFVARYKFPVINVGMNEFDDNNAINIFPNPANNTVTISFPHKSEIEILNIEGQVIKSFITSDTTATIDVSGFARGLYFVKMKTEKGIAVRKFVKD